MAFVFRRVAIPMVSLARSIHSTPANGALTGIDKINFNMTIYRKYGLLRDDTLLEEDPDVMEALSRLPEDQYMQRMFRSIRAQQLYLEHNILPESEWTKIDDNHEYLTPYLEEVKAERRERDQWERNH